MAPKRTKNQLRREKAKLRKLQQSNEESNSISPETLNNKPAEKLPVSNGNLKESEPQVEAEQEKGSDESVQKTENVKKSAEVNGKISTAEPKTETPNHSSLADTKSDILDKELADKYQHIFAKFNSISPTESRVIVRNSNISDESSSSSEDESSDEEYEKPLSKRQQRLRNKVSVAELKASTDKPGAVAWYDADAPDPYLCVAMKTSLNAVGVPSHWSQKKDYLSGKRGFELPPFRLPKFIQDTGIAEMRNYDPDTLKKQQRDRVQPKMGKLDIDYQKLHDAFFKHQTKPRHYKFGELYWEGREKADQHRDSVIHMRPGVVSKRLREAVGLSSSDPSIIPPWVTLMNSIGKPPSFQDSIIPGVDVAYENTGYKAGTSDGLNFQKNKQWGAFEKDVESESEDDEDEDEDEEEENDIEDNVESMHNSGEEEDGDEGAEKVDITEYSKYKADTKHVRETGSDQLYKVLKERQEPSADGSGDRKTVYDLDESKSEVEKSKKEIDEEPTVSGDDIETFEF